VTLVLLARNPTDSVTHGLLPAAERAGLPVLLLTDEPEAHRHEYAGRPPAPRVQGCAVDDARAVLGAVQSAFGSRRPAALATNSDHLQVTAALAADYLDLPGKDWRSALRARDKGLMRARLHETGLDDTPFARLRPEDAVRTARSVGLPCVLKPATGVASEDVVLARDDAELARLVADVRDRRDGDLLVEGLLTGPLHTLETVGDGTRRRIWGGWATTVSPPPFFIEERLTWRPSLAPEVTRTVLSQLDALGVGWGPAHTEFVLTAAGPRIVEVNDRLIGDHCDFAMADLLGEPVFDDVLRVYLGGEVAERPPTARPARSGHVHWVLADRAGVLRDAPAEVGSWLDPSGGSGVRVHYRAMRPVGDRIEVTGTNRDYLGALRVTGPDDASVDAATEAFLADRHWLIA
jgi:biotin carboxylase